MAPVSDLNQDVLREIFLYCAKPLLLDITLVCKQWHAAAQLLIDRTLDIVATGRFEKAILRLLERVLADALLRQRIRHIEILEWQLEPLQKIQMQGRRVRHDPWEDGRYFSATYDEEDLTSSTPGSREALEALCKAIASLDLLSFTWRALQAIPRAILDRLAAQQDCAVHLRRNSRAMDTTLYSYAPIVNNVQLQRLGAIAESLRSLELLIPPGDNMLLEMLGRLIARAPKLRHLDLYYMGRLWRVPQVPLHLMQRTPWCFRVQPSIRWLQVPISQLGSCLKIDTLIMDNFCVCQDSGFRLKDVVHPAGLQRLEISCMGFCQDSGHIRPRVFRLHCCPRQSPQAPDLCKRSWGSNVIASSLCSLDSLSELEILEGEKIMEPDTLRHLGRRLQRLVYQVPSDLSKNDVLCETQRLAESLSAFCPVLVDLTVRAPSTQSPFFDKFLDIWSKHATSTTRLALVCPAETPLVVPRQEPLPEEQPLILARMLKIWNKLSGGMSHLQELRLMISPPVPWDRDGRMIQGTLEKLRQQTRTLVATRTICSLSSGTIDLILSCVELDQASTAVRHQHFEPSTGHWQQEVRRLKTLVTRSDAPVLHGPLDFQNIE